MVGTYLSSKNCATLFHLIKMKNADLYVSFIKLTS